MDVKNELCTEMFTKVTCELDKNNIPQEFSVVDVKDGRELTKVVFQQGPCKENGTNGAGNEDLLLMVLTRLEAFQKTAYACKENEMAITKIQEALMWLRKRTNKRQMQGILGTHKLDGETKPSKRSLVISAFPGCGKSYCTKNSKLNYSIQDSDSSNYSWIKDADGNNTNERNPDFPANYINHIKELIGKVDIIFVSSHENVRQALKDAGINAIYVYPDKSLKDEYIRRFRERGNDEKFISFISSNWYRFIDQLDSESCEMKVKFMNPDSYINNSLEKIIEEAATIDGNRN